MIDAVHVVWITAGLGCDGDTIAMTAASLPSIEELVAGALPGVPRVILHNPRLPYYLGWSFRSAAGVPIVCVPGCPVQPDNFTETLSYLLQQLAGSAPMIPPDEALRPRWLFTQTVHEGCDRGGYYEQAVGTVPSVQLFSEYFVRLSRYVDFVKRMVPLHDDLFDFFLEALPGYERVGQRRVLLGCWGAFQDPDAGGVS